MLFRSIRNDSALRSVEGLAEGVRVEEERFIDTVSRIGIGPFKDHVYATPIDGEAVQAGESAYA